MSVCNKKCGNTTAGTPKRGEDGDQSTKPRRPPKAKKPSKISRMDKQTISGTACNSGTSCFVTKKGELYVFGKDSSHADFSTGRVADLTNQAINLEPSRLNQEKTFMVRGGGMNIKIFEVGKYYDN